MANYAIITDLNRCVGCLACTVACKAVNNVPVGQFWIKTHRVGPNPSEGGSGHFPDVEMYFLPMQCQHCENPACVDVCPTGASYVDENGTIQVDAEMCIGCSSCVTGCPYGVRYMNEDSMVAEKCTLCKDYVDEGRLPQCVMQCAARARFFGDLDQGYGSFEGPAAPSDPTDVSYEAMVGNRVKMEDYVEAYTDDEIYTITDEGTGPKHGYLLRKPRTWRS